MRWSVKKGVRQPEVLTSYVVGACVRTGDQAQLELQQP